MGKHVLSYQPHLLMSDPLPSNQAGWSSAVYEPSQLEQQLNLELFDPQTLEERNNRLKTISHPQGATQRVAELLLSRKEALS